MDAPFKRLVIPRPIRDALIECARRQLPNECCGVLAGTIADGTATAIQHFPIGNDLASPIEYATNARDLLMASKAIRAAGGEWLAIYHSHPLSSAMPSKTDLACNTYGTSVMHVIVGLAGAEPDVRGWWLAEYGFWKGELSIG